ncbi:CoA transferase subunit B [bacterium]|nr:CoA transferase subunit B [bacterium]
MPLTKEQLANRVAKEVKSGTYVNLGIGMPSLVANYISPEIDVTFQTENGILGLGGYPTENEVDADLTNASKQTVTTLPGAAIVDSVEAFSMIRGGHIDLTILGGMEVDQYGNIANWKIPGKLVKGMGGAMDLVAGAKRVIVMMQHTSPDGKSKILKNCTLPLTGKSVVSEVFTDFARFVFENGEMILTELAKDITLDELKAKTEASFKISPTLQILE